MDLVLHGEGGVGSGVSRATWRWHSRSSVGVRAVTHGIDAHDGGDVGGFGSRFVGHTSGRHSNQQWLTTKPQHNPQWLTQQNLVWS